MIAVASSPAHHSPWRPALAALAGGVALLAAVAAALGVFARGDGSFVTVTSARGEVYEMATTGVYANNALQVVAEGVGWDVFTLAVAAPALLLAAFGTWRGSSRAALIATGLLGYVLYLHLEYAVTWSFGPLRRGSSPACRRSSRSSSSAWHADWPSSSRSACSGRSSRRRHAPHGVHGAGPPTIRGVSCCTRPPATLIGSLPLPS